jgi:opacity protein-like surface antigen
MNKKIVFCLVLFISVANALPIGGYIGLRGGTSSGGFSEEKNGFKVESEPHFFGGLNAGIRIDPPFLNAFRVELEGLYRDSGAKIKHATFFTNKGIDSVTGLVNVYYDVISLPFVRGYVGGGVGYTKFTLDFLTGDKSFAYNLGVGVTATLLNILSVDLGWRYFNQGEIKINDTKLKVNSSDIYVGVRFGF